MLDGVPNADGIGPAIDSLIRSWNAVINAVSQHSSKTTARDRARQTWQYLRTNRVAVRPDKFIAQALVKGVVSGGDRRERDDWGAEGVWKEVGR